MNLTVNGQSQVPPGFRFHPTEEELLQYYLKKKVANQEIDLDVIQDVDLNKLEPWDIQEKCRIGSASQNDWYFFSHKDKKYPTGARTNRATTAGFWKATGRDKAIFSSSRRIGMRKTLVYYKGRAPHGEKSDWIMHEYRLDDNNNASNSGGDQSVATEDGWVICQIFKKKFYVKASFDGPKGSDLLSYKTNDLDQTIPYMGKTTDMDQMVQERFFTDPLHPFGDHNGSSSNNSIVNWVELDQLLAYQLNEESTSECFNSTTYHYTDHFGCLPYCVTDENDDQLC